jgi:3-deoxy-D-manno-octulosonic-acid transferase
VNARLSDRGFRRARRFRWIALPLWRDLSAILAGSETDARHFRALGFPEDRVQVTGSIKLDVEIPRLAPDQQARLRHELGIGEGPLIVGASTWPGEEKALIQVLRDLRARGLLARLLLVPRHAERRAELEALLSAAEFSHHFRSRGPSPAAVDVVVGDTTGELRSFLQLADLVFVGRSLPPHTEGQTPVEAAILERPLVFGPGMSNFRDIASGLVASGAAIVLDDVATRSETFFRLLTDGERRVLIVQNLRIWSATGKGAIARTCVAVANTIDG